MLRIIRRFSEVDLPNHTGQATFASALYRGHARITRAAMLGTFQPRLIQFGTNILYF